jgi:hypothetical protein
VARPHPVVDVTAVPADPRGGRVGEADVADLEALDQLVLEPAVIVDHDAPVPRVLLALRDQRLLPVLYRLVALPAARPLGDPAEDLARDVLHLDRDEDGRSRPRGQLLRPVRRQKSLLEQVPLLGRVVLDRAIGAVMVRDHEPLGGDEGGRAPGELDDRVHRVIHQVAEAGGIDPHPHRFQRAAQLRELVRPPHPFIGMGGDGRERENEQESDESSHDPDLLRGGRAPAGRAGEVSGPRAPGLSDVPGPESGRMKSNTRVKVDGNRTMAPACRPRFRP